MQHSRSSLQTFVIRIWVERHADYGEPSILRGSIVHVLSSDKRNITDLQQVVAFIEGYLQPEPNGETRESRECPEPGT